MPSCFSIVFYSQSLSLSLFFLDYILRKDIGYLLLMLIIVIRSKYHHRSGMNLEGSAAGLLKCELLKPLKSEKSVDFHYS